MPDDGPEDGTLDGPLASVTGFPAPSGPLDLQVHAGDIVLLRGPNGSGKTSLLRSFAGLPAALRPAQVRVLGRDPGRVPAQELARAVALVPQDPREGLVGLTVRSEFRLRRMALPPSVAGWAGRDVATLSSGEARRVGLAVARSGQPLLLLLDEPSEGLDAAARQGLLDLVRQAAQRGAVVAADHAGLLDEVATRAVDLAPRFTADGLDMRTLLAPAGAAAVLRAEEVAVDLGAPPSTTVQFPALQLPSGLHALAGPNGSGKSTLLLRLAGLRHSHGVSLLGGSPVPGESARLLLPHPGDLFTQATVGDEVSTAAPPDGLLPASALSGGSNGMLRRHPLSLSAGEAQRVALAKALGRPAALYLLDEPEAHLDAAGRAALLRALAAKVAGGACVVVATHDPALLAAAQSVVHLGPAPAMALELEAMHAEAA